ncbi:hypothetical protein [Ketobacter sp.]|uniref:hypothetical protein n=1 Tax=Ketobacter sp. TaxID=2083498 RepID=UPI0025C347E5|nr:hypothetical protein [Ketobacter sp.]
MSRLPLSLIVVLVLAASGCGDSDDSTQAAQTAAAPKAEAPAPKPAKAATASQYAGPDIAGLYLGMSPDEVKAVLSAYDPAMRVQESSQFFEYSALGKRYKTERFLVLTQGQMPGGSVVLSAGYTFPPEAPRVVAITRTHRQTSEPLTQADYAKALIEKYGTPVEDVKNDRAGAQAERILKWKLPGSGNIDCVHSASIGNGVLDRFVKDGRKMAVETVTPAYAAQCNGVFEYTLRGEPVTQANGTLFDVRALAKSEFETQAWVQQQVAEKSKTGTQAPKL